MTTRHPSRRSSPWPGAAWVMVGLTLLAGAVAVAGDILSPVVVLDVVSLWPLAAPGLLTGIVAILVPRTRPRLAALPPLFLFSWILLGSAIHLAAWPPLPSSSVDVIGPTGEVRGARLTAALDQGELRVSGRQEALFQIEVIRSGGHAGAPGVGVATGDGQARVVIAERSDSQWFRFAGWRLGLGPARWTLELEADPLIADLREVRVAGLELDGTGEVWLGRPSGEATVSIDGTHLLHIPAGIPARVSGAAIVPAEWEASADGLLAPVEGRGWVIEVADGASLTIESP